MATEIRKFKKDNLAVPVFKDDVSAGQGSADFVAKHLNDAIRAKGHANLILATGASQFAFIEAIKTLTID